MAKEPEQKNFRPKPIAELLDGRHLFVIPSFQRGYRWERKQVLDLLQDIRQFADYDAPEADSYFLQPVVVRPCVYKGEEAWEVLDGQQRLTTMLLVLKRLMSRLSEDERCDFEQSLYRIVYANRPQLDFDNPRAADNIDSYYLSEAKRVIDDWFASNRRHNLDKFKATLLYDQVKQVKLIWYAIEADSNDRDNINIFNRLNKGKIALTSAELIKALFIMDNELNGNADKKSSERLAIEWNEMERNFQNDKFWYFISDDDEGTQTRLDVLFDFVTCRPADSDSDYPYREFQRLYDHCRQAGRQCMDSGAEGEGNRFDSDWAKGVETMEDAWMLVKKTFDRLTAWFEDNLYYHYIGYLVAVGFTPLEIYRHLDRSKRKRQTESPEREWREEDTELVLRQLMMERFKEKNNFLKKEGIDDLEYGSDYVFRILLLFNVESCRRGGNVRFDFERFKTEKWDVEHIDSQNDATIQEFDDRMQWLRNIEFILGYEDDEKSVELKKECSDMITRFGAKGSVELGKYTDFYTRVNKHYAKESGENEDEVDLTSLRKDYLSNLTLLDFKTNREYKDAPFAYKRYCIVKHDREGHRFIPLCTRNVFLKYYSDTNRDSSHLDRLRWSSADRKGYIGAIHEMIDPVFDSVNKD